MCPGSPLELTLVVQSEKHTYNKVAGVWYTGFMDGRGAGSWPSWYLGRAGGAFPVNLTQYGFCSHPNGIAEIFEGNPIT